MTDKEKIKEQANIDISNLRMAQEQGIITEFGKGKFEALEGIVNFIDSLQEEPVSNPTPNEKMSVERWKRACESACCDINYRSHYGFTETRDDYFVDGVQWADENPKEEPVSEDLKKASIIHSEIVRNTSVIDEDFIAGSKWKEHHLWKSAEGPDLPIFDREVIVLTQPYPLEGSEYVVSFSHRPNPNGYDGKSLTTRKVEHYTPKIYDKGGWNIPNVKWWLDCDLPNEIEK